MHGWIANLIEAGHVHRNGDGVSAGEASRLAYEKMVRERRWDMEGAMSLGRGVGGLQVYDLFGYNHGR